MPIRWTPEKDQYLLLKILETSHINADVKAICQSWADDGEVPTPRAIKERLCKIRSLAKGRGEGSFKVVGTGKTQNGTPENSPAKANTPGKAKPPPRTPSKRSAKETAGGKRKRYSDDDESDESEIKFKTEGNGTDASDSEDTTMITSKRAKVANLEVEAKEEGSAANGNGINTLQEI
ncbi:MAG: hypothetical protein LQ352_007189 [Teloschistes flavicans]|nr:MAG: hypothetical protein LQ352_007189 [Teloschistes flavicans]